MLSHHKLSHSHSFNLSFIHSQHAEQLLFSCLCSKSLSDTHSPTLSIAHVVTLNMLNIVFMSMLKSQYLTLTLSHSPPLSLTLSLCHSPTLTFTHSQHAKQLLFSCPGSKVAVYWWKHSHSHTLSHSLTLNMLNNFCFHVYDQKSLSHTPTLSFTHS